MFRAWWFDPVAEAPELSDHSGSALSLRSFGDRWTAFLVAHSLVQDQPDQATLSMDNCSNGLIMSQAHDRPAIPNFEDAPFGFWLRLSQPQKSQRSNSRQLFV